LPDDESLKGTITKNALTHPRQAEILWGSPRGLEVKNEYLELTERVLRISSQVMNFVLTTVKGGEASAQNEIENIPRFLFSPGVKNLFNLFETNN